MSVKWRRERQLVHSNNAYILNSLHLIAGYIAKMAVKDEEYDYLFKGTVI